MKGPFLFGPWRRRLQAALIVTVLALPFCTVNDIALLRIDIPRLTLFLAGHTLRIEELYIFWIFALSFIFFFLLVTILFGRIWCGWFCPQTILADIADSLKISKKDAGLPLLLRQTLFLFLALLIGANFVWYFIGPTTFFARLINGNLGTWPTGTMLTLAGIVYCDLAFIRRLFCTDLCPYGRFQTVLIDRATLTLQAHPAHLGRCIDCKACVKVCPTGIDIRTGFQIECINCAQCLDACRKVMAKKNQPGIIQYTIGQHDLGLRSLLSLKTIAISFLFLLLFGAGLYLSGNRATVALAIGRAPNRPTIVLSDGRLATFYSGSLVNRTNEEQILSLQVRQKNGEELEIQGPTLYRLQPNERRELHFAVRSKRPAADEPLALLFRVTDQNGAPAGQVPGFISGITDTLQH